MENTKIFDNGKLIASVQNHPSLWDKKNLEYTNKISKEKSWRQVLKNMYNEEDVDNWKQEKLNRISKFLFA